MINNFCKWAIFEFCKFFIEKMRKGTLLNKYFIIYCKKHCKKNNFVL